MFFALPLLAIEWGTIIPVGVFAALIVAAIAVGIVIFLYSRKVRSETYPLGKYAGLSLTHSRDDFTGKTVTRVRIRSSSNKRK